MRPAMLGFEPKSASQILQQRLDKRTRRTRSPSGRRSRGGSTASSVGSG